MDFSSSLDNSIDMHGILYYTHSFKHDMYVFDVDWISPLISYFTGLIIIGKFSINQSVNQFKKMSKEAYHFC